MEHRWLREEAARTLIDRSDAQRRDYYRAFFSADWSDPREYHATVNSGRLGALAIDFIDFAAQRFWDTQQN
jgi:hypothetical protein